MGEDPLNVVDRSIKGKARAVIAPGFFRFMVCSILWSGTAFSQQPSSIISDLHLQGNRGRSDAEVVSWLQLRVGGPYDDSLLASDLEVIVARYAREGYFGAAVDSVTLQHEEDGRSVALTFFIDEGRLAVVRSLSVEGTAERLPPDLLGSMQTRTGEPFRQPALEADIQTLLNLYEEQGFPFAAISVHALDIDEGEEVDSVTVILKLVEGKSVRLRELRIEGNETTASRTILRESRFKEGGVFRGEYPLLIQRRLERSQLFSSVSLPELYINEDGSAGLLVKVTEGSYNHFDGIVGYIPASRAGEQGFLTGLVQVQFRNILGTGRRFSTRWSREERGTQDIQLRYVEPWVASLPLNLEGDFAQRKQDSIYVRRQYGLAADLMITEEFSVGASFSQSSVVPSEGQGAGRIADSKTTSVGLTVFYDTWNDPVTPSSGIRYRAEYHTGSKRVGGIASLQGNRSSSTQRARLDLEYVVSLFSRQVVATSLFLREIRSGDLDPSDLYRLGGTTTLRGYREGEFLGSRLAWVNAEYRVLVSPRSFAFGFVDAAYMMTPDRPSVGLVQHEQSRIGYGIGIRLDTALGLIGVSLALGEGDTFGTAKLHFRLINEF
jgi:outer membrane protein insertion porin family